MLFTSGMQRALDHHRGSGEANALAISKTASETARLLARKRAHLVRRHTCSVLTPGTGMLGEEAVELDNLSRILPGTTASQVSFIDPETDRVIMVDTTTLIDPNRLSAHRRSSRHRQRSSVGNLIKHVTVCKIPNTIRK